VPHETDDLARKRVIVARMCGYGVQPPFEPRARAVKMFVADDFSARGIGSMSERSRGTMWVSRWTHARVCNLRSDLGAKLPDAIRDADCCSRFHVRV
jgi:hypothetical protein